MLVTAQDPPEKAPAGDRLVSIDVLRGIAVLMVMLTHLPFSHTGIGGATLDPNAAVYPGRLAQHLAGYGAYGVHLFLVISGFCIHLRWVRARDPEATVDFVGFWRRRLARLYPVYFVALIGTVLALFVVHGILLGGLGTGSLATAFGYESETQLAIDLVLLVLLLQNLNQASHRVGNGPFWSLALEEQLYVLYFPLLWIRKRHGWRAVFLVTGATSLGWRIAGLAAAEHVGATWYLIAPSFWWPWALGAWAVEAHDGRVPTPRWLLGPAPVVLTLAACLACRPPVPGWAGLPGTEPLGDLVFATLGFLAVLHVTRRARASSPQGALQRALYRFGVGSYSLYLAHDVAYKASKQIAVELDMPDWLTLAARFAAGVLAGWLLYVIVERPTLAWARRFRVRVGRPRVPT